MAVLPILTGADNPILRKKAQKVTKITKDMEATTKKADGLGLAAPQVGQSIRLCLVRLNKKMVPIMNPLIFWWSEEIEVAEEGCLSLPNFWMNVPRPVSIAVRYMDAKGEEQERKLSGLEARIVQHETDHLNGVLITDYANTLPHQAL